ncbi:OLC1v1035580C3 [Oldenlandia corymbosa var. corymbosa]|uniref:OLC1v1035580C3 n=1 Tax=Oldenlandia corymbosa var. corymbosa TaxID=529605 RepID=A0AAV1CTZ9_OLDCO|nr:OLC1v1035580C3 [Oldenlandia corymbosa var. corymbosa]
MDVGRRKRGTASSRTGVVVAGSVWESRMKLDEVKGGIKVFNDEENVDSSEGNGNDEMDVTPNDCNAIVPVEMDKKMNLRPRQSPPPAVGSGGKRKTWKSESLEGSPIQIARKRSELYSKNLDEQYKEISMSADGINKKSPIIQNKKTRSDAAIKELSTSVDGMKTRSASRKLVTDSNDVVIEKNSTQLRKLKSDASKALNNNGSEKSSELRKVKSESIKVPPDDDENAKKKNSLQLVVANSISSENLDEKKSVGIKKIGSDENCKEVGVCEEKVITTNLVQDKSPPKLEDIDDFDDADEDEEDWNEDEDVEVEIEKKSLVVKEVNTPEQKKPKKIVVEEKKFRHSNERPLSIPSVVKKQSPPLMSHARVHPSPPTTKPDEFDGIPRTHRKVQSFVDLVMWRNVSKSALVFGIGTFVILSSSYTKDLNISVISVLSYLALVYLAAIFLFRSFISRGGVESDDDDSRMNYVFGHQEAVWFVNLVLPYVNEFLVNIRALFSGDPLTTMKAVAFGIFTIVWNLSSVVARIWAVFMLFVAFRYFQPSLGLEGWAASQQAEQTRTEDSSRPGPVLNAGNNITQRRRPIVTDLGKQNRPL